MEGVITEIFHSNTFSATVFATYGGFNLSYGALYLPQIGLAYVSLLVLISSPLMRISGLHTPWMGLSDKSFTTLLVSTSPSGTSLPLSSCESEGVYYTHNALIIYIALAHSARHILLLQRSDLRSVR
jgi:hypothetical protein